MIVLAIIVVVVILSLGTAATRQRSERAARQRANREVRQALQGDAASVRRQLTEFGRRFRGASIRQALAAVRACRATSAREVAAALVELAGHRADAVGEAASLALNDLGAHGLRTAWEALSRAEGLATNRLQGFIAAHPDWLFTHLMDAFAAQGPSAVAAYRAWWLTDGVRHRLELLITVSDAVNRERAQAIQSLLSGPSDHVA